MISFILEIPFTRLPFIPWAKHVNQALLFLHYLLWTVLKESSLSAKIAATSSPADDCSLHLPRVPLNSKGSVLIIFSLKISTPINHLQPVSVHTLASAPHSKIEADGVEWETWRWAAGPNGMVWVDYKWRRSKRLPVFRMVQEVSLSWLKWSTITTSFHSLNGTATCSRTLSSTVLGTCISSHTTLCLVPTQPNHPFWSPTGRCLWKQLSMTSSLVSSPKAHQTRVPWIINTLSKCTRGVCLSW